MDKSEWAGRVGQIWAQEWRRTDRSFKILTKHLLEMAKETPFAQALDIGCGAGEVSLCLAKNYPASHVTGVDVSEDLLAVARDRGENMPNLRFDLADMARWSAEEGQKPDLLISRHGVMFFPKPSRAFTHLRVQSGPNARLIFSCFRERQDNEWAMQLAHAVGTPSPPSDPRAPGPFAFGESAYVENILHDAGWEEIVLEAFDFSMTVGEGANALDNAVSYFLHIGSAARAIAGMEGEEREAAIARLRSMLAENLHAGHIELPASAWIVKARAPG